MKNFSKLLLYYSTAFSAFIFIVSLVTSRSNTSLLLNILFFPVVLYLLYSAIKKDSFLEGIKDSTIIYLAVFFCCLFLFGVYRVSQSKMVIENVQTTSASAPIIIKRAE